jgi:hypothetical protein
MQHFARNHIQPSQLRDFLLAIAQTADRKWLLVDHGVIDVTKSLRIADTLGWPRHVALSGSSLDAFGTSGPQLLEVPVSPPADLVEALARWIAIEPTAAGLSVVSSSGAPDELQSVLAYLALATVEDDQRLHCRFADVRVLINLLPALSPTQSLRVAGAVQSWWWLDELGECRHWSAKPATADQQPATTPDQSDHLQLSNGQFARMLDASEADIIFSLLLDKTSELVPATGRGNFRLNLQRILATATRFAVTQTPDRLQFVVLSLATTETFHAHPELASTWLNIREHGASLTREMESWSDDLWAKLDSGRRPAQ